MATKVRQIAVSTPGSFPFSNLQKLGIVIPQRIWMANATNGQYIIKINNENFALGDRQVTFIYQTDEGPDQSNSPDITTVSFENLNISNINWNEQDFLGNSVKSILLDVVEKIV